MLHILCKEAVFYCNASCAFCTKKEPESHLPPAHWRTCARIKSSNSSSFLPSVLKGLTGLKSPPEQQLDELSSSHWSLTATRDPAMEDITAATNQTFIMEALESVHLMKRNQINIISIKIPRRGSKFKKIP